MTNVKNLVHEADAQRHHVRVKLPAKINIGGHIFETGDWSTAGASIAAADKEGMAILSAQKVHNALLMFNFNGFELNVPMTVEVRHAKEDAGEGVIGLRYVDMTQEQIVIMQQLVNSYVTGELSSVGELIHVMSRNNFTKPRQIPKKEDMTPKERAMALLRKFAIPAISLILLSYVGLSVFEQNFIVTAQKAAVTADSQAVITTSGGVASFKDLHPGARVKKGDVLMTILSATGTVSGVDSPCDCIVEQRLGNTGEIVTKGQTVFKLVPVDSPLHVESYVEYKDAIKIDEGQSVTLDLAGGKGRIGGEVLGLNMNSGEGRLVIVKIRPKEKLDADLVGLPVGVRINVFGKGAK